MYFESVFIKPNNNINIYNIRLSKKFMKIAFFNVYKKWVETFTVCYPSARLTIRLIVPSTMAGVQCVHEA